MLIFLVATLLSCGNVQSKDDNATKELYASDIIKMIKKGKPVQVANAIIFDDLDFSKVGDMYITSGTSAAVDVDVPLYFFNCTFIGNVNAKSKVKSKVVCITNFRRPVTFTACDFRSDIDFTRSLFVDNVDFSKTIFRGEAKFDMITMRGEHNRFYEIVCESSFSMSAARAAGTVTFLDGKFNNGLRLQSFVAGNLNLNNVVVTGETQISDMLLHGAFMANYADLGVVLNMSYSKFLATTSICHTKVMNLADLSNCIFIAGAKFNDCSVHSIDLTKSVFLTSPEFIGTNLSEVPKEKMIYKVIRQEDVDFREKVRDLTLMNKNAGPGISCDVDRDSRVEE